MMRFPKPWAPLEPGTSVIRSRYGVATNSPYFGSTITGKFLPETQARLGIGGMPLARQQFAGGLPTQFMPIGESPMPQQEQAGLMNNTVAGMPGLQSGASAWNLSQPADTSFGESLDGGQSQYEQQAPAQNATQRWQGSSSQTANGERTPEQMAQEEKDLFMLRGGSNRTWNRAGRAMGMAPRIDARSRPSSRNSTAGTDLRAKWGWGADPALPY